MGLPVRVSDHVIDEARKEQILTYLLRGYTINEIAEELEINTSQTQRYVSAIHEDLKQIRTEDMTAYAVIQFQQCQKLLKEWLPLAEMGSDKAAMVTLKIMKRQADLYGLDAVPKQQNNGNHLTIISDSQRVTRIEALLKTIETRRDGGATPEMLPSEIIDVQSTVEPEEDWEDFSDPDLEE